MKKGSLNNKKSRGDKMMILMIVCVLLSLITLSIVAYDKLIKNKECDCRDSYVSCWNK